MCGRTDKDVKQTDERRRTTTKDGAPGLTVNEVFCYSEASPDELPDSSRRCCLLTGK